MKINSVDRALRVIELLSEYPRGLRLTEMAKMLGFNASSLHHLVNTLKPYEYIAQDSDTKRYSLGLRFLEIGKRVLDSIDVRKIARVHLEELKKKCGFAVHLVILKGKKVIYIDKIDAEQGISLATYIGYSTEAYAASGGKILLSTKLNSELRLLYEKEVFKSYGKKTVANFEELLADLEFIRKNGYALDDEEYYEGIRCIAAPITAGPKTIAAISITGSIHEFTDEIIENKLKGMVLECAEAISSKLHW